MELGDVELGDVDLGDVELGDRGADRADTRVCGLRFLFRAPAWTS
jgi:hypothetical protein